ncbi:hypothetical protein Dimus_037859 [Dionaea muscipula]
MFSDLEVDAGAFLAQHLLKVAHSTHGDICVGGLITPIAISLGYDLSRLSPVGGRRLIDIDMLTSMGMIRRVNSIFYLTWRGADHTVRLPAPARITVQDRDNWLVPDVPEEDVQLPPGGAPPPPPAHHDLPRPAPRGRGRTFEDRMFDMMAEMRESIREGRSETVAALTTMSERIRSIEDYIRQQQQPPP